jgi:hypothetical protein
MTQQQKLAWFNVIVCTVTLVTYAILLRIGGPTVAFAAHAWMAVLALGPFFYRRSGSAAVYDERDRIIHAQSVKVAGAALILYAVAACMGPWFALGHHATVSVSVLPAALMIGVILFISAQSISMLVQYQRGV